MKVLLVAALLAGCSASADPTSGVNRFESVRVQLQDDPTVVRQMLLVPEATGEFGCEMDVLRWDPDGRRFYARLACADDVGGSSIPAVVDLARSGDGAWLVTGVQFPRQWALQEDYRRMFPPEVRRLARRG